MWNDLREVVIFSTADWDHPYWTNKQHVAAQLAALGWRVLYIESLGLRGPRWCSRDLGRIARRLRRAARPLRQARENLWVLSPLALPWHSHAAVRRANERMLSALVNHASARLGFRAPVVWAYNPLVLPVAQALPRSLLVYHAVDDLAAAPHMPAASIDAAEHQMARAADLIFTTSPKLQTRFQSLRPSGVHYLPNVADYAHFSRAQAPGGELAEMAAIPRPRLGFVGALSAYKVDFDLILAVARARRDWHWAMIGQVGEGQPDTRLGALGGEPNVHLLGPKPYALLPEYLRSFDVATIPAATNDYTASMFPMKFFEYLSAGKPVVASGTPALAGHLDVCRLASSPAEFIGAIDEALRGGGPSREIRDRLARTFTWEWRMREMLRHLEQARDRPPAPLRKVA